MVLFNNEKKIGIKDNDEYKMAALIVPLNKYNYLPYQLLIVKSYSVFTFIYFYGFLFILYSAFFIDLYRNNYINLSVIKITCRE